MNYAFVVISKKPLPNSKSPRISMLSSFYIRSRTHFELIFVKGIRSVPTCHFFFFSVVECPDASVLFVFKTIFSPLNSLCSSVKDQLIIFVWTYFWPLYPVPLTYLSFLLPVLHFFDYCSFAVSLKVKQCYSFNFVLLQCCID